MQKYKTKLVKLSRQIYKKNKLVILAPKFAVDLIDLIEQNRRNSVLFRGQFY